MNNKETDDNITVLIADDDHAAVETLSKALAKVAPEVVCHEANSLEAAEYLTEELQPSLIFLDMEFPGANGLEWYESMAFPPHTRVVFYTIYRRYLHDALSSRVFDFLLKPFDLDDLSIVMNRFRTESSVPATLARPLDISVPGGSKSIAITTITNDKVIVGPSGILYFRYDTERKLWECVLTSLKRFILKRQTTAETILNYGGDFVRTHKRYIININYLEMISGTDCRLLPPFEGINEIRISKSFRRQLLDRFYDI